MSTDPRVQGQCAIAREGAEPLTVLETDGMDVAEGRKAGERLAGIPVARRPAAVLCADDLLALGLLQQAVRLASGPPGPGPSSATTTSSSPRRPPCR